MNKRQLNELARELRYEIGDVPRINNGGCGVVAVTLYRELERRGEKPQLIEFGPEYCHLVVKVGKLYLDASGVFAKSVREAVNKASGMYAMHTRNAHISTRRAKVEHFESLIQFGSAWNPSFDRRQIPHVMNKIKEVVARIVGH